MGCHLDLFPLAGPVLVMGPLGGPEVPLVGRGVPLVGRDGMPLVGRDEMPLVGL